MNMDRRKPVRHTVSLHNTITPAILDTVIGHLAGHFMGGANGDLPTARHAAGRMLACYKVGNRGGTASRQ